MHISPACILLDSSTLPEHNPLLIASPKSSFQPFGSAAPSEAIRNSPWPVEANSKKIDLLLSECKPKVGECRGCGSQLPSTRNQSGAIVPAPSAAPRSSLCAAEITRGL